MPRLDWREYLSMLEKSPSSLSRAINSLMPRDPLRIPRSIQIFKLNYSLWNFQEEVLNRIAGSTLILGLPTGLGKTYIAGAYLMRESQVKPIRVLFLVPSIPLGVQQTLFARSMLEVKHAYFISGAMPPEKRLKLGVWNWEFIVCTPQTVYNDLLTPFQDYFNEARKTSDPVNFLRGVFQKPPLSFDVVVADECQNYIGETDGYSILLAAKACNLKILALSATPHLHSTKRLEELKRIFEKIEVVSVEEDAVKAIIPRRALKIIRVDSPPSLLELYKALGSIVDSYRSRILEIYGENHLNEVCRRHGLCLNMRILENLRKRVVEDGASSVLGYRAWRNTDLQKPLKEFKEASTVELFRRALMECRNHKHDAVLTLLETVDYSKAIVFTESIRAAKQLGLKLIEKMGFENVSILVGKEDMSPEHQASALLHFSKTARVLVATSVAEEGLDIPSADVEIWVDPPSNPKKWIQRFGRVLRQPKGKKEARVYALVTKGTHEEAKLRRVLRISEKVYGFTQRVSVETLKLRSNFQKSLKGFT
ncbi:MAG: helicase-related protein [Candidatus Bathyarchaeia archaeon]